LNGGQAVHAANTLEEHPFNQDSLLYFARALTVADESEPTRRAETNWWGGFKNHVVFAHSNEPITRQQRKAMFDKFFRRTTQMPKCPSQRDRMASEALSTNVVPSAVLAPMNEFPA
jgi:hypothetical protein